jgi:hypothetical protein
MSRPVLTIVNVRTTLRVDIDGARVGAVHRDVSHRLLDGRKVSEVRFTGIADCRCEASRSVFTGALSDDDAARKVTDHMRVMHAFNGVRGVA